MPRPSNTVERRAQIARALLHVMSKTGYERATIAEVADVAELAPGLVHYHFKNKLEMLLSACEELGASYEARLAWYLTPLAGQPARELRAFIDAHLHPGSGADPAALACWVDLSGEALREPRVKKALGRALGLATARLVDILRRGDKARLFTCREPEVAAAALMATIQGYFILSATARELVPRGSASRATLAMCEGLLGKALPASSLPSAKATSTKARGTKAPARKAAARKARA